MLVSERKVRSTNPELPKNYTRRNNAMKKYKSKKNWRRKIVTGKNTVEMSQAGHQSNQPTRISSQMWNYRISQCDIRQATKTPTNRKEVVGPLVVSSTVYVRV
jgi:hypothetical protein